MARSKPFVSDERVAQIARGTTSIIRDIFPEIPDLASDLLECRARLKAWDRVAAEVAALDRRWGVSSLLPSSDYSAHHIIKAFRAIPPEHRPEPQWEPDARDVAVVDAAAKVDSSWTETCRNILRALHDAGRLK